MDRAFHVLPGVLSKRGLKDHAHGALLVYRAQKWLCDRLPLLSKVLHVQKVQNGTLVVTCTHSVAVQECQSVSPELLHFLKEECAFAPVSDIRITRV